MYIYYPHGLDLPTTQQQQQQQQPITTVARQQRAAHTQTDRGLAVAEGSVSLPRCERWQRRSLKRRKQPGCSASSGLSGLENELATSTIIQV